MPIPYRSLWRVEFLRGGCQGRTRAAEGAGGISLLIGRAGARLRCSPTVRGFAEHWGRETRQRRCSEKTCTHPQGCVHLL